MSLTTIIFLFIFILPIAIGIFVVRYSRKLSYALFSIPFIFMLGVAGWWLFEANHRFIGSTDLANEKIADIELLATVNDSYKSSHGDYDSEDNVRYREFLQFETFAIGTDFENNEIVYIKTESPKLTTEKGVQIGDSVEDVIDLYGDKNYQSNEMGMGRSINYVDRDAGIHLQFWLEDDVVHKIAMYTM